MALTPGTRLGVYEITAQIGEGGMGAVYRATDTSLSRAVAIKVLPDAFAQDADRLARFEREAKTLAALNHPNIAAIYGLERSSGTLALVMELVEGDDLSQRISRGAIPLDEALPIAKQIAEALEAAHEQGIIHRDLKPANIKVRADGRVKVLDFGLAKAMERSGETGASGRPGGRDLSASPTLTSPAMTQAGIVLGTAPYMSPEQAKGRLVDRRADIWAFGAVLFEMLAGTRAFPGEDITDTIVAVMSQEPDFATLPATVPARVVQALRVCLRKDAKQRAHDMADVRLALDGAFETATQAVPVPEPSSRMRVFAGLAVVALMGTLVVAALMWSWAGRAPAPEAPARVSVMAPPNRPIFISRAPTRSLAISPDGTRLVYVGLNPEAPADELCRRTQLELRDLGSLAVRDLPGTAGAIQPFFSPDGQWVGFFTGAGDLKKVALAGGNPITLVTKINGAVFSFGVWAEDHTIIFGTPSSGLRRVSAEGGEGTELTTVDVKGERWHSHPALVPSGRAVLYWVAGTSGNRIDAMTLGSGERRRVVENGYAPGVLHSGHLLFQRDGATLIAPFDLERLTVTGAAVPLVDAVRPDSPTVNTYPVAQLAVSRSGTLTYVPDADAAPAALVLTGRDGTAQPLGPPPQNSAFPRVSPDGRSVAFLQVRGQQRDVLVYDLGRGSTTRLT